MYPTIIYIFPPGSSSGWIRIELTIRDPDPAAMDLTKMNKQMNGISNLTKMQCSGYGIGFSPDPGLQPIVKHSEELSNNILS